MTDPLTRHIRFTVRPGQGDGATLLDLLTRRFTYHDAEAWQRLIATRRILLNAAPAAPAALLRIGDQITFDATGIPEPPVQTAWRTVHEDDRLLVIDKPPNLPCHPAGRYFNHTLWALLLRARRPAAPPTLINRLDRETSGLVVTAKDPGATRHLMRQFAGRLAVKRYTVLVEGPFPDTLDADGWILPDTASPVRKKRRFIPFSPAATHPDSARAQTHFARVWTDGALSALHAFPRTGRLHQIRATLLALGFPVVGDKLYGIDERNFLRFRDGALTPGDLRRLRLPRQALHAGRLRLAHPSTGLPLELAAPLPPDLAALAPGLSD